MMRSLILLSVLALPTSAMAQTAEEASLSGFWRTTQNCGANCLYLLCHAHGYEFDYDTVLAATPIGAQGSTLADLQQAANHLGVATKVGKGTPLDLLSAQLPIMIHMDDLTGDVEATGHYVLVTRLDTERNIVDIFDGSSAIRVQIAMNRLQRDWSGYVLEMQPSRQGFYKLMVSLATLVLAGWIFCRRSAAVGAAR